MFYVYEHWRSDKGKPFYVGKGSIISTGTHRGQKRRAFCMDNRNKLHKKITRRLALKGLQPIVKIVFETGSEDAAFAEEIRRIKFWRDSGVFLANFVDGGGGVVGWKHSEETKKKISRMKRGIRTRLGHTPSEETRRKLSASLKLVMGTPESRKRASALVSGENNPFYGRTHTAETRDKISAIHKGKKCTAEEIAKRNATRSRNIAIHGSRKSGNGRLAALKRWETRSRKWTPEAIAKRTATLKANRVARNIATDQLTLFGSTYSTPVTATPTR